MCCSFENRSSHGPFSTVPSPSVSLVDVLHSFLPTINVNSINCYCVIPKSSPGYIIPLSRPLPLSTNPFPLSRLFPYLWCLSSSVPRGSRRPIGFRLIRASANPRTAPPNTGTREICMRGFASSERSGGQDFRSVKPGTSGRMRRLTKQTGDQQWPRRKLH